MRMPRSCTSWFVALGMFAFAAGCGQDSAPGTAPGTGGSGGQAGAGGRPGGGGTGGAGGAGVPGGSGGGGSGAAGGGPAGGRDGGAPNDTSTSALDAAADAAAEAGPGDGSSGPADAAGETADPAGAVVWPIDNLRSIGGHPTMVLGAPTVIDAPMGKALQFDGNDDALFVENHPLARLPQFTVEILFRPDAGGSPAQRFFHMDAGGAGRVLFETRLPGNNSWVLDVFVESPVGEVAMYDAAKTHPLGAWYHLAAVIDGQRGRSYVNGVEQFSSALNFRPHPSGRTSIGVRITRMYFFKGAIALARFTPRVLTPAEFLKRP